MDIKGILLVFCTIVYFLTRDVYLKDTLEYIRTQHERLQLFDSESNHTNEAHSF